MSKNKLRLLERVKAAAESRRHGPRPWFDRIPKDFADELLEIRRALKAGDLDVSARFAAKEIIDDCVERGIKPPSWDWMRLWLAKD